MLFPMKYTIVLETHGVGHDSEEANYLTARTAIGYNNYLIVSVTVLTKNKSRIIVESAASSKPLIAFYNTIN